MRLHLRLDSCITLPLLLGLISSIPPIPSYILSTSAQAQTSQDPKTKADKLLQQGNLQFQLRQYQAAIQSWKLALAIYQRIRDYSGQGITLKNLGLVYDSLGQYAEALDFFQQALVNFRENGNSLDQGQTFKKIGAIYIYLGQYHQSLEAFQQALIIFREIGNFPEVGDTLNNKGLIFRRLGQYPQALEDYQQALAIFREIGDIARQGTTLNNIGLVNHYLSQYSQALENFQQALVIFRKIGDLAGEGTTLNNIGLTYSNLGQYFYAIEYFQQALVIRSQLGDSATERSILLNIGAVYRSLGQCSNALVFYEQSLQLSRIIGDRYSEGVIFSNIGAIYDCLEQYSKSLEYYQQALTIIGAVGAKAELGTILSNIGGVYNSLEQHNKAFEYYQQALTIIREVGDRTGEGTTLNNIGGVYDSLGQYSKGLKYYQQALTIRQRIGDREGEGISLNNIASTLQKQKQPELAIVFYKQSVNVREAIRYDIRTLPREQQESYTQTVADTYRRLANLLLSQGRLLEAQQVLELLKIQELRDFTRNARAGGETSGIVLARIEENILNKYGTLIIFGQQVYECEQKKCSTLSQLRDQLDVLTQKFQQDANAFRKTLQDRLAKDPALLEPEQLRTTAAKIVTTQPGTILIYPLVVKDKIRILLASRAGEKGVVFRSFETPVDQQQLWKTVNQFRIRLSNREDETAIKTTSQQLYKWLIQPLEKEIKNSNVHHLVFSLDRSTRYIPMAALFDGQQYLIERYAVSTVLNAGLTDAKDRLPKNKQEVRVLAMGVSKAFPGFNALSYVPDELATIIQQSGKAQQGIFPGSEFLNENFTFNSLRDNLTGNKVLHLATHGKFESGRPENSYLLSGSGEPLTVDKIQTLGNYMADTHLVVLSACETALGGVDADGLEMSGMSFYFLTNGAKSVIASLWLVNDASTSQLMQRFYQNLSTGQMTKTEALRQAQLAMLKSNSQGNSSHRSSVNYKLGQGEQSISRNLSHPYYWAPFILIGNGW
jgi:CHAT domain-containing protein/Tfp pilus assembly protein PilF